ncbi:Uncharacterized protein APZ42_009113 [Daphnia magna]|uniref:Secreted protein n=1 Tax=Daphnia magna TaxID=35525 RepID=A0A164E7H7_9CRUS|nr:Uncharacterized protein APZ42_009113 [Daphnia magna]
MNFFFLIVNNFTVVHLRMTCNTKTLAWINVKIRFFGSNVNAICKSDNLVASLNKALVFPNILEHLTLWWYNENRVVKAFLL